MAKPTPEVLAKRKAKAKRSTMTNRIRVALANGNEKEGYRLASLLGEDIFLSRLPKEYQSPAESWFVAKEAEMKALEANKNLGANQDLAVQTSQPIDQIKAPSGADSIFSPEVQAVVEAKVEIPNIVEGVEGGDVAFPYSREESHPNDISTLKEQLAGECPSGERPQEIPREHPPEALVCIRGWPVKCSAEVWGTCRNPNLMVALLHDGTNRKVSMYQGRFRKFQLRTTVELTLEQPFLDGERQGDPIYVPSERRTNIW